MTKVVKTWPGFCNREKFCATAKTIRGKEGLNHNTWRGATHLLGTLVNPVLRILIGDSSGYLQPIGPGSNCLECCLLVARSKLHHMPTSQIVLLVQFRIVAGGELGDVVGLQVFGNVAEGPTHNLLDLPRVQVNAGPELGHFSLASRKSRSAKSSDAKVPPPHLRCRGAYRLFLSHVISSLVPKKTSGEHRRGDT